jgi:hypothetical protein
VGCGDRTHGWRNIALVFAQRAKTTITCCLPEVDLERRPTLLSHGWHASASVLAAGMEREQTVRSRIACGRSCRVALTIRLSVIGQREAARIASRAN